MNKRHVLTTIAVVTAIIILAYGPSLQNQFVNWDDDAHFLNNPFVRSFNIKEILTTTVNGIYIPLTSLSFALEYHFFKATPFIYHLDNLLLHLAVTAMVFLFCLRCGSSVPAAGAAALIFGLHPMHVESVAWATGRKDVLYAFFYMLALLCYLRHLRRLEQGTACRRGWEFWLTLIFGFLSVLAKPMAFSLPFALLACDWFLRRRTSISSLVEKIYCGLAVMPVVWMTYVLQARAWDVSLSRSVLTSIWCFLFYIKKFFYPDYFVPIYHLPAPAGLIDPVYLLTASFFILWTAIIFFYRKDRVFIFANMFYFISIFLLLDHSWTINAVADRFMYLPMLGWCMFVGNFYVNLWTRYRNAVIGRAALLFVGIAALSFLFFQTARQSRVWYNGASLWEHQLRHQSQAATALVYNKLAQAYMQEPGFENNSGKIQMAEDYLHKAIAIKPDYAQAHFHLGQLAARKKDFALAQAYFKKTIELDTGHFDAYFQLGWLYGRNGQYGQAIEAFHKAIQVKPDHEDMYRQILDFYDATTAAGRQIYEQERDGLAREYIDRFQRHP